MHIYTHTYIPKNIHTFVPYSTKSNIVCTAFPVHENVFPSYERLWITRCLLVAQQVCVISFLKQDRQLHINTQYNAAQFSIISASIVFQ